MRKVAYLVLVLSNVFITSSLHSQASVVNDTVYYLENHPVDFADEIYKSAPQIDEIGIPISENLRVRVFYPTDLAPEEKRPLVVFIHGGGFIGGSYASFFDEAEALAKLGYITASIQYRLCKRGDCLLAAGLSFPCNVAWANSLIPSMYAATVDAGDAIKWLQLHADDYYIDSSNIAVAGHSAGAWTALNAAYLDQDEINEICNSCGTWPDYLEGDLANSPTIKAVINMSGAILDTLWLDADESDIDLLSIHGTHDGVVYYGSEPVYPCCNTYTIPVQGSCPITERYQALSGNSYMLSGTNYAHDVFLASWWPDNQEQILWFLGKSFFDDTPFQKHSEYSRPNPIETCPPPLPPQAAASLCDIPLSDPGIVLFSPLVGIDEVNAWTDIKIFPNPASSILHVELGSGSDVGLIQIRNTLGQTIQEEVAESINFQMDVSGLEPGLYWLSFNKKTAKLIIAK